MPLTAKQQKNVEILIDQHFDGVRRDLQNGRGATGWPKVESTPELQQLAETHAKVLELQDRQALDALKIYNDALTSLGFDTQPVPYALSSPTPQTTERRAEHLVQLVINTTRNRLGREADEKYRLTWDAVDAAWKKARRDVLILSLDGSEALKLVEGLPTLESFLTEE